MTLCMYRPVGVDEEERNCPCFHQGPKQTKIEKEFEFIDTLYDLGLELVLRDNLDQFELCGREATITFMRPFWLAHYIDPTRDPDQFLSMVEKDPPEESSLSDEYRCTWGCGRNFYGLSAWRDQIRRHETEECSAHTPLSCQAYLGDKFKRDESLDTAPGYEGPSALSNHWKLEPAEIKTNLWTIAISAS